MKATIKAPAEMVDKLNVFFAEHGQQVRVSASETAQLTVELAPGRNESNLEVLYCGGWISCETARQLADDLALPLADMGALLNSLDVKVRRCALGCF